MGYLGCHLSASRGFAAMVETAEKIGADTFAYFTRNPWGSRARAEDPEDAALAVQQFEPATPVIGHMGNMTQSFDHVRQQSALHRIVIDNKNMGCHESLLLWTRGTLGQPHVPIHATIRATKG